MKNKAQILATFKKHGSDASFHFANDTGKEDGLGRESRDKALAIFDTHPALQAQMRKIAGGFLWTLEYFREE